MLKPLAIKKPFFKKPILVSPAENPSVSTGNFSNNNLVGQDAVQLLTNSNNTLYRNFSPRLLNWVEPYSISGMVKSLFYTEVNSGLKVGDRVFIINGNYDSNELIKKDKYKKGRDGYKILYIDRCAVVLDIDYTGVLPYNEHNQDDFVNVYYIRNKQDFQHANRQVTTKNGIFDYKFNPYNNNIIYADQDYLPEIGWGETLGLTGSPGFYVKNGTYSWTNITSQFVSGSFSIALSTTYSKNKLKIHNYTFTYSIGPAVVEFKEDYVYVWDMAPEPDAITGTYSTWINDPTYNRAILTKGNFRDGNFKGTWNTGLFGTSNKRISWEGGTAKWNNGTLLNTKWLTGVIDSKFTQPESFVTEFDTYGLPSQKVTGPNNNGKGYNFIISSELLNSTIVNGTIIDTIIGQTPTYSLIENYLISATTSYDNQVQNASFESCRFLGGFINNAELKNTRAINTYFKNIKSINSNFRLSIIKDSTYLSDNIIKILGYDEFNYNLIPSFTGASHKVYKFYISQSSYQRLKLRDRFYFKGIKFNNNSNYPLNFFDKRFIVSSWSEYYDELSATFSFYKRGVEVGAFLSSPADNSYQYNNLSSGGTIIIATNSNPKYSVDIVFSTNDKLNIPITGLDFNQSSNSTIAYPNDTIFIQYFDTSVVYSENLPPSGYYDGRPYYILTNGTTSPYSYIFYTASNNRWEQWQNFDPISGNTFGSDFYRTLSVTTSVPNSSTVSWVVAVDVNQGVINSVPYIQGSLTLPTSLGNTIDISNAWILDSDFESGLFETSNWNSGYHMNYNNDVNMTTNPAIGKYYNITVATSSQSLIITTLYDQFFVEAGENCLNPGNVVYLNAVDYDTAGRIDSFTISATGSGYTTSTGLTASGGSGTGLILDIDSTAGGIDVATVSYGGLGYEIGDTVVISGGNFDGEIIVLSITGSVTRLPDTYKITSNTLGVLTLQEIVTGSFSVIQSLLNNGLSYTTDTYNRWGYIYKAKFEKSKIKSGIFRRSYLSGNLIDDEEYTETDKDFVNLEGIRELLISDTLFSNNGNILSKATYMNSSFVTGSDLQVGGIIFNSIWNGPTFSNGVFKQGRWMNGTFKNGTFYNSKSFNNSATASYPHYYTERTKNYWTEGPTDLILANDRYSWQNGTFLDGEFYKSDWEEGEFKNGKFYFSKFYGGTISGGIIGEDSIQSADTHVYNATVSYTTVENATFYAIDTSHYQSTQANINWKNGIFNAGVFGSDMLQTTASNVAIWYDGVFNNGQFISNARWKEGIFNGGKFLSGFGWTMSSSTTKEDYTWEDGTFNGGEFGTADTATNSTWYGGDFNGGAFKGRLWNDGVFTGGDFYGSGLTATGGLSSSNASDFVDSFIGGFYGYWRTGFVSDMKDKYATQEKIFTELISSKSYKGLKPIFKMQDMLWESGTFSHPRVDMRNSVWLSGAFERGKMTNSSFNPYVKRGGSFTPTFNLDDTSCYWENGNFDGGDFYISEFQDGKFIIGTAYGMIFKSGVSNYMNAFNVFWEDGLWRNGNWYGSYFTYDSGVTDPFTLEILYRGMSWSSSTNCHLWNIFQDTTDNEATIQSSTNSVISGVITEESQIPAPSPIFSDITMKENIVQIGKSPSGLNIYEFNYKGDVQKYRGVVAQELLNTQFEVALTKDSIGRYMVNYSIIDVEFEKINI
jgi:uncharacterized protein YjbI with pentapeptide repeats